MGWGEASRTSSASSLRLQRLLRCPLLCPQGYMEYLKHPPPKPRPLLLSVRRDPPHILFNHHRRHLSPPSPSAPSPSSPPSSSPPCILPPVQGTTSSPSPGMNSICICCPWCCSQPLSPPEQEGWMPNFMLVAGTYSSLMAGLWEPRNNSRKGRGPQPWQKLIMSYHFIGGGWRRVI